MFTFVHVLKQTLNQLRTPVKHQPNSVFIHGHRGVYALECVHQAVCLFIHTAKGIVR